MFQHCKLYSTSMHYMPVKLFMLVDYGMLHVDAGVHVNIK